MVFGFAKGRSSSFRLNGVFRKLIGHMVLGRVSFANLWVRTHINPSDDPSRFVSLRAPSPAPLWLRDMLICTGDAWASYYRHVPQLRWRKCREIFSGFGELTSSLARLDLVVDTPMDCYKIKKSYVAFFDIMQPDVFSRLLWQIRNREYAFIHLGIPCSTWGPAGWLNKGIRRAGREAGDGSLGPPTNL